MSYEAERTQLISEFEAEAAAIRKAFGVKGKAAKTSEPSKTEKPATEAKGGKDASKSSPKS